MGANLEGANLKGTNINRTIWLLEDIDKYKCQIETATFQEIFQRFNGENIGYSRK